MKLISGETTADRGTQAVIQRSDAANVARRPADEGVHAPAVSIAAADFQLPPPSPTAIDTDDSVPRQTAYARYCALGDVYAKLGSGVSDATMYYELALNFATEEEQKVLPHDHWLLVSLKQQRQEES